MGLAIFHWCYANERNTSKADNAKLRCCSCDMIMLYFNEASHRSSEDMSLIIKTHLRAANSLLASDQLKLAEKYFEVSQDTWKKAQLEKPYFVEGNPELGFDLFKGRSKCSWMKKDYDEALKYAQAQASQAKSPKLKHEILTLSMWMFNCGIELCKKQYLLPASKWLEEACAVMELDSEIDVYAEKQSRTLRMLAFVLLELKQYDRALATVEQALSTSLCAEGLFLHAKILLLAERELEAEEALFECLSNNGCGLKMGITLCVLGSELGFSDISSKGFQKLSERFPGEDLIIATKFKCLAAASPDKAFAVLEDYDCTSLSANAKLEIMDVIWSLSCAAFEKKQFESALGFLQRGLRLLNGDSVNRARTLRAIAICYEQLGKLQEALENIKLASVDDVGNPLTILHKTLYHLKLQQPDEAEQSLQSIVNNLTFSAEMWSLVAEEARKTSGAENVTVMALDGLLRHTDSSESVLDQIVIYRNIIELSIKSNIPKELVATGKQDCDESKKDSREEQSANDIAMQSPPKMQLNREETIEVKYFQPLLKLLREKKNVEPNMLRWFAEQSWNLGLTAAATNQFVTCSRLMKHSYDLFSMLPNSKDEDTVLLNQRISSLIISATAQLEAAVCNQSPERQKMLASESLSMLVQASNLRSQLSNDFQPSIQYILEIKCKILMQDLMLMKAITDLPIGTPAESFFVIGALCIEYNRPKEAYKALREGITVNMVAPTIDVDSLSEQYRALISIASKNDLLAIYKEVANFGKELEKTKTVFPPLDAHWIVAHAWNHGVVFFRLKNYTESEIYMAGAIEMIKTILPAAEQQRKEMENSHTIVLGYIGGVTAAVDD